MPDVVAHIRKTFNNPPDANPWTYDYLQEGVLETVVVNQATAQAAFNAVRTRYIAESFAGDTKTVGVRFFSSAIVEAEIVKSDDASPWSYRYRQNGHLESSQDGFATANDAMVAVRDRYLAEPGGLAAAIFAIQLRFSSQEAP